MTNCVSIIVPCYNQAQYLDDCLKSVFDQIYQNWECIIIDDGSFDESYTIAEKWTKKDSRFVYFYKENGGLSSARNRGLKLVKGDFVLFLDADDIIDPEKLSKSIFQFEKDLELAIVVSNYNIVYGNKLQKTPPFYQLSADILNFKSIVNLWDIDFAIPIHCAVFRQSCLHGLCFNENLKAKEDWLFWIQFFKINLKAVFIEESLVSYRKHAESMTHSSEHLRTSEEMVMGYIKKELSWEEYEQFLIDRINYHKNRYFEVSRKYSAIKNGSTYRLALRFKSAFKKIGLFNSAKNILQKIRK